MRNPTIIGALALLSLGLTLQLWPKKDAYFFKPDRPLQDYLAGPGDGWSVRDLPLGPTESATRFSHETLRLDDFVFRRYRKGAREFAVYLAYWRPGSQSETEVGIHNPDTCWAGAGWKTAGEGASVALDLPDGKSWPGQYRYLQLGGERQHVIFWHIMGGRPTGQAMRRDDISSQLHYIAENIWRSATESRGYEQYVVRISSNVPFAQLEADPYFARILLELEPFGLRSR